MEKFHHPQLVPAPLPAEFYRIHVLAYEMQTQAAWPYILQLAPTELLAVQGDTAILQYDFKGGFVRAVQRHLNAVKGSFDRLLRIPPVSVANDICQGLINGQNYAATFCLGESKSVSEFSERISDNAKSLWIAAQFHSQEQTSLTHENSPLPVLETGPIHWPDQLLQQLACISRGNGKIRPAKAPKYREIYANDLSIAIKERPARAAGRSCRVIHNLVL